MRSAEATSDGVAISLGKNGLPEGWSLTKLGTIAILVSGVGFPKKYQGKVGLPYPFFKVGNLGEVDAGQLLKESPNTVNAEIIRELRAKVIPRNTVVFAKIGMAIGLNRRRLTGVPCCIDNNMMASIPSEAVLPCYLLRFLETIEFMPFTQATTVPSLRKKDLENLSLPLPPLAEQKRIVAKVEELLARVNLVREHLAKVKDILKRFRQSVLAAACSGRLTVGWRDENLNVEPARVLSSSIEEKREREYAEECRRAKAEKRRKPSKWTNLSQRLHAENAEEFASIPSTWIYIPLGKVAGRGTDSIVDGPFGTSINVKTDYINCGVPVVRINNIRAFRFLPDDLRFVSELKYQQLTRHCILPGDVLLTKVGTIGETCVFPDSYVKAMLSTTGSCRIRVDAELADNKYICIYLNSLKQYLNSIVSESVQPFLNMRVIKNVPTALPPLEEQREIVRRVEALFNLADAIEERVASAGERAERLTQAILAKAFRGELVPIEAELARIEGRPYEPAPALLAKIN